MNLDEAFLDKSENTPIKLDFQGAVQSDYAISGPNTIGLRCSSTLMPQLMCRPDKVIEK